MSNSIDYTTISTQPHQITTPSSKPRPLKEPIKTNQRAAGSNLRPSETLDDQYHQLNNQLTPDESDLDPADRPLELATIATKTNNASPAGEAAGAPTTRSLYVYRECQKNHAASMGSYVVDGCGEFMPSGEKGTAQALKCAACQCHRSFHRRDAEYANNTQQLIFLTNSQYAYPSSKNEIKIGTKISGRNHSFQPSTITPHHRDSHRRREIMAFGGPTDSSSEDLTMVRVNVRGREETMTGESPSSKKRFRTKFSKEQKVRMQQVAEELGWKIQKKEDEEQVEQLCVELGVKRQVFKVWMHNNKQK